VGVATKIKDNGLPEGSGLYWKDKARTQIWIRISHRGVAKSYASGTTEWKKALVERDRLKADLIKGERKQTTNKVVRINDLLDDYIGELKRKAAVHGEYGAGTAYSVEVTSAKHLRPVFGNMKPAALTTADLNRYRDARIAEYRLVGKQEGSWIVSINRELSYLRAALRLGMKATPKKVSAYPHFPIDARAERSRARTGIVARDQFALLMDAAADHLKPVLALVTYAGLRAKEAKFIRREQVDWEKKVIRLRDGETKEGKGRDVPLVEAAVAPLKKWMDFSAEFFPESQSLFHYRGKRVASWKTAWNAACRRAGLVKPILNSDGTPKLDKRGKQTYRNLVHFHDTRRTAITVQGRAGVSEADSQRVTGHHTIEVHRRYDQDQDAAVRTREAINNYLAEKPLAEPKPAATEPADGLAGLTLKDLVEYRRDGMLTDEEFVAAKARIFGK
jgi:integrase